MSLVHSCPAQERVRVRRCGRERMRNDLVVGNDVIAPMGDERTMQFLLPGFSSGEQLFETCRHWSIHVTASVHSLLNSYRLPLIHTWHLVLTCGNVWLKRVCAGRSLPVSFRGNAMQFLTRLAAVLLACGAINASGQTYSIDAHVVSAGSSATLVSSCLRLQATIAEPVTGSTSATPDSIWAGFQAVAPINNDGIFFSGFEVCP